MIEIFDNDNESYRVSFNDNCEVTEVLKIIKIWPTPNLMMNKKLKKIIDHARVAKDEDGLIK